MALVPVLSLTMDDSAGINSCQCDAGVQLKGAIIPSTADLRTNANNRHGPLVANCARPRLRWRGYPCSETATITFQCKQRTPRRSSGFSGTPESHTENAPITSEGAAARMTNCNAETTQTFIVPADRLIATRYAATSSSSSAILHHAACYNAASVLITPANDRLAGRFRRRLAVASRN